jgi:hypothetical protein
MDQFGRDMALPVVFFIFACRQLALYAVHWRNNWRKHSASDSISPLAKLGATLRVPMR